MKLFVILSLALVGLVSAHDLDGKDIGSCDLSTIGSLPEHIEPYAYYLMLDPDLNSMTVDGSAKVVLNIVKTDKLHLGLTGKYSSRHVYLHVDESVNITGLSIDVQKSDNRIVDACIDAKNQLIDIHLESKLKDDQNIQLNMDFNVNVRDDGKGIYQVEENGAKYIRTNFADGGIRYAFPSFDDPRFDNSMIQLTIATDPKLYAKSSTAVASEFLIFRDNKKLLKIKFTQTKFVHINGLEFVVGDEEVIKNVGPIHELPEYKPLRPTLLEMRQMRVEQEINRAKHGLGK